MKLSGKNYFVEKIRKENINDKYISWLNDKEVNKYLEIRHRSKISNEIIELCTIF